MSNINHCIFNNLVRQAVRCLRQANIFYYFCGMGVNFSIRNIILTISILLSPAYAMSQVNAEQVINIGRNVLSMEDYMLAIRYFNLAARAKPYLADPYYYRGLAKLMLEDYEGAETDCSMAIERNKFMTEAYKARGFARQNLGQDSLAICDYDMGLAYNPTDKYFLYYKAIAQTELKKYEGADSTFNTLLRAYPRFEDGIAARARMNLEKGDTVKALNDLEHAISLSKNLAMAYSLHAQIMADRKEWQKAAEDMDAVIKLLPRETTLYINRAFIRYNNDDYFGAMADYNYALELEPENTAALFNRALLRYEVNNLARSADDLTAVLRLEPENVHARFNRGLINLELGKNREAINDFNEVARKYPKYHTVYYAIAQAYQNMGNTRAAGDNYRKANDMVARYVHNPQQNPLQRPVISAGEAYDKSKQNNAEESDAEVMEKFNRLVTVNDKMETRPSYNEKIKGRIQNRDARIEPEPYYALTMTYSSTAIPGANTRFKELTELNSGGLLKSTIYIAPENTASSSHEEIDRLFQIKGEYDSSIANSSARPVDFFGRGVARYSLKDYKGAISDMDSAIQGDPTFTAAYLGRASARISDSRNIQKESGDGLSLYTAAMRAALADLDKALSLNPGLIYALYDKALILSELHDMTSALTCLTELIGLYPEFGPAYFNRGIIYLSLGQRTQGLTDIRKAGELGVLPSYNLLKRMK